MDPKAPLGKRNEAREKERSQDRAQENVKVEKSNRRKPSKRAALAMKAGGKGSKGVSL